MSIKKDSIYFENLPQKMRKSRHLNLKPYIFGVFIHLIGIISQFSYISGHFTHVQWVNIVWYYQKNWIILLQLDLKHIHKVNFYPSDNNFTQALLVMLVTNIISVQWSSLSMLMIYITSPFERKTYCSNVFPAKLYICVRKMWQQ